MRIFDCFPFAGTRTELYLLECRLCELYDSVDAFVIVEADVDHQNRPKPYRYREWADLFSPWKDKIEYVQASGLPTSEHKSNPWAREHAQREWIASGLEHLKAERQDIVLQSDADEIPRPLHVRNCLPRMGAAVSFHQRGHFWAVDWDYPPGWNGTVACRYGTLQALAENRNCGPFTAMRDMRNKAPKLPDAGWHFSWLGGPDAWETKVNSFCHPEVEEDIRWGPERFWREGIHVDGTHMLPVDLDTSWPKWMHNPNNIPDSWWRPRSEAGQSR